ncbi:DNA repair ATPase [Neptuniibacter sp. QD72_48]|uniref:DNA repair ATPase n=1 Tax=Neptuniibacter sp. QD72_48 TaxID=3398214 RepID=UPI0039F55CC4
MDQNQDVLNQAVESGGAYEILKARLASQGAELKGLVDQLNKARQEAFGASSTELVGKVNVHTQNNCLPVDMAQVNDQLLFGYQVFVGLKAAPEVKDVLGLYRLSETDGQFRIDSEPLADSFLDDPRFVHSFNELFRYYSDAKLVQISRRDFWLFVVFQIGSRPEDRKVYRWQLKNSGAIEYVDDQGHKELDGVGNQLDVDWRETGRKNHITGDYPHVSINDRIFVECVGGDLTVKLENNTQEGRGIYSEPVEDPHQTVADAEISYAEVSSFILLRIRPNREKDYRYFVYDSLTEKVQRVDSIGQCCKLLPEDHGLLFANGYALANGELKLFQDDWSGMQFFHDIHAPNGEDAFYIFFDPQHGAYLQYQYNLIEKTVSPPVYSHGYSLYPDGRMLVFRVSDNAEASKTHPMRIWQTPFMSADLYEASRQEGGEGFYRNLGNAELVKGISELNSVIQMTKTTEVSQTLYEALVTHCGAAVDQYHWLTDTESQGVDHKLSELATTAEQIIDEFAKVRTLQKQAKQQTEEQAQKQHDLLGRIKLVPSDSTTDLIELLDETKSQLGHVISLREMRYVNASQLDEMEVALEEARSGLNAKLLELLQQEKAYQPYLKRIDKLDLALPETEKTAALDLLAEDAGKIRRDLNLVNQEVSDIETDDPTSTTKILDLTTEVMARLNATEARLRNRRSELRDGEAKAEFASQLKLLTQAMTSALGQVDTPEACDDQLARLMGIVDKLESRFAEFDQYLAEIYNRRDEVQAAFEAQKQQLLSARQKRVENISQAAQITLKSIQKRVGKFAELDDLNSYFAADAMVQKYRQLCKDVQDLGDSVKADELSGRIKALQDQSLRSLRDNQDIFEQGGDILRLGRHKFSVNQQPLELTLVDRDDGLNLHLTGTDFYQPVVDDEFLRLRKYAAMDVSSESNDVYRAEYLAYLILTSAESKQSGLSLDLLVKAASENELQPLVDKFAAPRYREGYVKGVHDKDAGTLLKAIMPVYADAGLLRFSQQIRTTGLLFIAGLDNSAADALKKQCRSALLMQKELGSDSAFDVLLENYQTQVCECPILAKQALEYLMYQFGLDQQVSVSRDAAELAENYLAFRHGLDWRKNQESLAEQYQDHLLWVEAYCEHHKEGIEFVTEAALIAALSDSSIHLTPVDFSLSIKVNGLLGEHLRVEEGKWSETINDWLDRCRHHIETVVPAYEKYLSQRQEMLEKQRETMRIQEFVARPLTSFVRNKLISESYLKLMGDNFAKQMGTTGDDRRTDQMGMLLLISPPGYGKTTLIEYIAGKLGLVFMKINCPSLGHDVVSLDPNDAPNATAANEVNKINLALEMGNNVMLYLDDIQHTNPEFLQKFISLSDGTRRIDGVWNGVTKTYDMRGRKFSIVMAGNPYTESGDVFKIPDMLANRADIYNLGDMLSDQRDAFELSYIENSLTSNRVLAPLANRNLQDLYKLVDMARGQNIPLSDLEHSYSSAEASEIVAVLEKMLKVQQVVLTVNQQYIASAATAEQYRIEPPFKLQGSYRNMNKLAEKVVSVMTDDELETLINDHYIGEAQTLTHGAEENLLKLAELRGILDDESEERWDTIKQRFTRSLEAGEGEDAGDRMVNQMVDVNRNIRLIAWAMMRATKEIEAAEELEEI